MTSDRLSFASVEINKSYSFTLSPWKNLCHRWSRDQPRPGSLFPTTREAEERDPGNEVAPVRPRRHVVKNAYVRHIFQEKENGTARLSGGPKLPIHMVSVPVCFGALVQRINFSIYTTKMEGAGPQMLGTGDKFKRVPCQKSCRVNRALMLLGKRSSAYYHQSDKKINCPKKYTVENSRSQIENSSR